MPDITKKSFESDYFKTGDLGEIIDGYLYYRGRKKEMIKTGGISVYPIDIERVLREVEGVREVAVVGVEDEYFGEAVIAVVVGEVKKEALIKKASKLAPYQRPLFYDIVKELPKNRLGKIQKFKLKEKYKNLKIGKRLKGIL
jgi:acyl-CoA synthetase (AMP-forming)/AMP-acid ligase II